jgi:hypothetical protein
MRCRRSDVGRFGSSLVQVQSEGRYHGKAGLMFLFRPRFRSSDAHWPPGRGLRSRFVARITLPTCTTFIPANVAKDGSTSLKQLVCMSMLGWACYRTHHGRGSPELRRARQSYCKKTLHATPWRARSQVTKGSAPVRRRMEGRSKSMGVPRRKGPAITATSSRHIQRMANCCRGQDGLGVTEAACTAPSQMCAMPRKGFQ